MLQMKNWIELIEIIIDFIDVIIILLEYYF